MSVENLSAALVSELMVRNVQTVHPKSTTGHATRIMGQYGIRHLIVCEEERKPIGVFSQRDLLMHIGRCFTQGKSASRTEVWELMTRTVVTVLETTPLAEAAHLMAKRKIGCVPVVDHKGYLVGILSRSDLLRHMASYHLMEPELI